MEPDVEGLSQQVLVNQAALRKVIAPNQLQKRSFTAIEAGGLLAQRNYKVQFLEGPQRQQQRLDHQVLGEAQDQKQQQD